MNMIGKVLKYESRKLFSDKWRLFLTISICLLIVGIAFLICWTRVHEGHIIPYTKEIEDTYIALRDQSYLDYLIAIGEKPVPEAPGEIYVYKDASECFKQYQYYSFILSNKSFDYYRGFSQTQSFFDFFHLEQNAFAKPSSGRLFYYQDIVYILLPILFSVNTYYVFVTDKEIGFNKNYQSFEIKKHQLFIGKTLFVMIFDFLLTIIFLLLGLVFINGDNYLLFSNDYHLYSSTAIYLLKWIEVLLLMVSLNLLFILISMFSKNKYVYFVSSLPFVLYVLSLLVIIRTNFENGIIDNYFQFIPFYSFCTSDSFIDGKAFYRLYILIPIILIFVGSALYYFRYKNKEIKEILDSGDSIIVSNK